MPATHEPNELLLRRLLAAPFVLLVATAILLGVRSLFAGGAADELGYPHNLPVAAGLLAAAPAIAFGVFAAAAVWTTTDGAFRIQTPRLWAGLLSIAAGSGLLLAYVFIVGNPEHYKGAFNPVTQQWDPAFDSYGQYLFTVLGVATTFPLGALAVVAKYFYVDSIQPAKLDEPEGIDPIGEIMGRRVV